MSGFQHSQRDGFPFTPSLIRSGRRVDDSQVTAPGIPDAARPATSDVLPAVTVPARTGPAALRQELRAGTPIGRETDVRLLPLQAFVWGSRAMPPQPRTRPDHTLIWVTEGRVQLDFPREHITMRPGDLRHIPAGTAFAAIPLSNAVGHVLLMSSRLASQAEPPLPEHGLAARVGNLAGALEATLQDLAIETSRADTGALFCLINLLAQRLTQLVPASPAPFAQDPGPPDLPLIERFLTLAARRLGAARSVAELAAELQSTTAALDQACLAARGKRAVELVHDLQLERAADLLRHTDRPTLSIAADLGYSSHAHFIRAFVTATGRTPDAFRAQPC